jgi:hypothetical protein
MISLAFKNGHQNKVDKQLKNGKVIQEFGIDRVRKSGNCTSPHYYNARILPLGSCVLGIGE